MRQLLIWIEGTGLGHFMRESGPWTYAVVNTAHILGVASLFGSTPRARSPAARRLDAVCASSDLASMPSRRSP